MMRPVIGITTYGRADKRVDNPLFDEHFASPAPYTDAVRRAGGVPVLLPPGTDEVGEWLHLADGFILTGGADIHPDHYGGDIAHPDLLPTSADRDGAEMAFTRALLAHGAKPALFICRGLQVLNVALGGTLHAHIPDIRGDDIHRGDDGGWTLQGVDVTPGSGLAAAMQATRVDTYSGHHQAVDRVADGLHVTATAPDGIVEGLEVAGHPFALAVQWHPEVSAHSDATQQTLFNSLVAASLG